MRADLQATYGIDLDHAISGEHTPNHIGALVRFFPPNSNINQEISRDAKWTREEWILASIQNNLRNLIYGLTPKDKRGEPPKLLGPSWMTAPQMKSLPARVLTVEKLMEELEKPRRRNV